MAESPVRIGRVDRLPDPASDERFKTNVLSAALAFGGRCQTGTGDDVAGSTVNIFADILERIHSANRALIAAGILPAGIDQSRVLVEPPRDAINGDMATNAAMVLAKPAGKHPRELAEAMAIALRSDPRVLKAEVAGPGFINLTLRTHVWIEALRAALQMGAGFGRSDLGRGAALNLEYVSANPTGPIHVGHGRGAVFGDALANLLEFVGYRVTREFYLNDAGAQVDLLARSAYLRYCEALGERVVFPDGLYPGDYLKPVGAALAAQHGDALKAMPESRWLPVVREEALAAMLAAIRNDLAALNVRHEVFFSERSLFQGRCDAVAATIAALRSAGLIYEGRLPPPKGQSVEDWEDREQTLFRATQFGDDIDRPLMKSDGSYTYFASDIAYHQSKFERGFRRMVDVWGADHGGYVKRLQAAVKAVTAGRATLDVKIVQLVRLFRRGEPVKMSKRAGEFVTLRDVLDEVGRDAVRFMMLFRKNDAILDFDLTKVIEQSRDNPVFYVQYAHARGQSVLRNARELLDTLPPSAAERASVLAQADLQQLTDAAEVALMKQIALYPRLIEAAALAHEPHRIAFYLYDLASEFHVQWTRGKDSPHLRFIIINDPQLTLARLALVQGVVTVLASGLNLLGVGAPDEMR